MSANVRSSDLKRVRSVDICPDDFIYNSQVHTIFYRNMNYDQHMNM